MIVFWELTYSCNLCCCFCYASSTDDNCIINYDLVIDKFLEMNVNEVIIAGGEPLLFPDLYHILQMLTSHNIKYSIITNGTLITENFIQKYKSLGGDTVTVSIDGPKCEHDFIRGYGNYDKAICGINMLVSSNIKTCVTVTITKYNCTKLIETSTILNELGISSIRFGRCLPNGNPKSFDWLIDYKDLHEIWRQYELLEEMDIPVNIDIRDFYLFINKNNTLKKCDCICNDILFFTIRPNGTVAICPHLNFDVAHILNDSKEVILKNIFAYKKRKILVIPESCKNCVFSLDCFGGCKAISNSLFKDFKHADLLCPYQNIKNV